MSPKKRRGRRATQKGTRWGSRSTDSLRELSYFLENLSDPYSEMIGIWGQMKEKGTSTLKKKEGRQSRGYWNHKGELKNLRLLG